MCEEIFPKDSLEKLDASFKHGGKRFERVATHYRTYVRNNPDHAFATTLEGVTLRKKYVFSSTGQREPSQLDHLFKQTHDRNMKQMLQHCAKARGAIRDILGQVSRPPSSSIPGAGLPEGAGD